MAIEFSPSLRRFLEVWVGASVASGNEDLGYDSRLPYQKLADDLRGLSTAMQGAISQVGISMPPAVAEQFVGAMKLFVDDHGVNYLYRMSDELEKTGDRQVDRSRKLAEAKYEILIEFSFMNLELALIALLSVFTGGTSLLEAMAVRARTALQIILIMQRMGRAVPTPFTAVLEALEEAFTSFFAQFLSMTVPDNPDRQRKGFDWVDVGRSAFVGFFAGLFGGALAEVYGKFVTKHFKDNRWLKEGSEVPFAFVNEGQAETFAMGLQRWVFDGKPGLSWQDFWMAGVSGALTTSAEIVVGAAGLGLHHQFFLRPSLNDNSFVDKPGVLDSPDAVRVNSAHPLAVGDWEGARFTVPPEALGVEGRVGLGVPDMVRPAVTLSSLPPLLLPPNGPGVPGAEVGLGAVAASGSLPGADVPDLTDAPRFPGNLSVVSDLSGVSDLSEVSDFSDGASVFSDVSDASSFTDVEDDSVSVSDTGMDTGMDTGLGLVKGAGAPGVRADGAVGATGVFSRSGLPEAADASGELRAGRGGAGLEGSAGAGAQVRGAGSSGAGGEVRGPASGSGARAEDGTLEGVQSQDETGLVLETAHGAGQDETPGTSAGAGSAHSSRAGSSISAPGHQTSEPRISRQDSQGVDAVADTEVSQEREDGGAGEVESMPALSGPTSPVRPAVSAAGVPTVAGQSPVGQSPAGDSEVIASAPSPTVPTVAGQSPAGQSPAGDSEVIASAPSPTAAAAGSGTGTGVWQDSTSGTATTATATATGMPTSSATPASSAATISGTRTPTTSGDPRTAGAPAATGAGVMGTSGGRPGWQSVPGVVRPSVESTVPRIVVEPVAGVTQGGVLPAQGQRGAGRDGVPGGRFGQSRAAAASAGRSFSGVFASAGDRMPSMGGRAGSRWQAPEVVAREITDSSGSAYRGDVLRRQGRRGA
ncbi:hypothetical protein OHB49_44990 (plasmid) [Streptomyces sp. NBC_01717]|uniref:hypothetical protein n=1 Tax=Streptomyces sp. NBC_01717 TaxID=2975918 RepID=UPI002E2ECA92|nr:hypothetical protein [Streptomyces sp. NBC_01717]